MLITVPQADRSFFRGMGLLGRRRGLFGHGLGQDDGTDTSIYDLGAISNATDVSTPSGYTIPDTPAPSIAGTNTPIDLGSTFYPPAPANTVLTAQGVAVPKSGYAISPVTGAVVPSSSLSGISSAFASIPSSYWLIGGAAILGLAVLNSGGKKRRR